MDSGAAQPTGRIVAGEVGRVDALVREGHRRAPLPGTLRPGGHPQQPNASARAGGGSGKLTGEAVTVLHRGIFQKTPTWPGSVERIGYSEGGE